MAFKVLLLALACVLIHEAHGHGRMMDPVSRSSVWRIFSGYPANYNDHELFCGGKLIDWSKPGAGANCGVCGDPAGVGSPQPNQNTGKYGRGKIARTYKSGQVIDVSVTLTTNHKGTFEYSLCQLSGANALDTENCFKDLTFEDGSKRFTVPAGISEFKNRVRLPAGIKCARCVLRWQYIAGQHWNGPQETYRNCADITIE